MTAESPDDPVDSAGSGPRGRGRERTAGAIRLLAILACAALVWFRAPDAFRDPHLWAEEASVYFAHAWEHGFVESLTTPHLGYASLVPNAATAVAAHALPLEQAPYATLAAGCLVLALLLLVVFLPGSPFPTPGLQAAAALLILLIPPGYLRLHTTFAHFWLCIAAALILISEPEGRWPNRARRAVLAIAGLTGVVSVFLAPLFWLQWLRERWREQLVWSAIITACAALQVATWLQAGAGSEPLAESRFGTFGPLLPLAVVFNQTIVHLFLGRPAMMSAATWLRDLARDGPAGTDEWLRVAGVALAVVVLALAMIGPRAGAGRSRGVVLVLAYVIVVLASLYAGTTGVEGSRRAFLDAHSRYFYAPNAFVAVALLWQLARARSPAWRSIYAVLVLWLFAVGANAYRSQTPPALLSGPSWRAEVSAWRENPEHPIRVWPDRRWPPLILAPR